MMTVKVDERCQVTLPRQAAGREFTVENAPNGVIRLVPVQTRETEAFPKGSLLPYITPESNEELARLAHGSVPGPVE